MTFGKGAAHVTVIATVTSTSIATSTAKVSPASKILFQRILDYPNLYITFNYRFENPVQLIQRFNG